MKFILLIIYIFITSQVFLRAEDPFDLVKIGKALGFPADQMIIEDYLQTERFIYTTQSVVEAGNQTSPPFSPEHILKAYKIMGKNPSSFLPIIITIVDKDTYESDRMKSLRSRLAPIVEKPSAEGGRLPYGDFEISATEIGFFLIDEIRTPAHPLYEKSGSLEIGLYVNDCPQTAMSHISFLQVANSNVDLRIAQYKGIEDYTKDFELVLGGEKYFNRFSYPNLDDDGNQVGPQIKRIEPFDQMIIEVFKALNTEVLESPILNSFRKDQKPSAPVIVPNITVPAQPIISEETKTLPVQTTSEISSPPPKEKSWLWLWIITLLAALSLIALFVKRLKVKRS